ncbi:MAG: type II secretion system protein GspD [Planctomycetota bacterium JB042]
MQNRILPLVLVVSVAFVAPAFGQNPGQTGNESSGVQTRSGDESPNSGFSTGQTNNRLDDYFNQDEQINIDPDSGVVKVLRVNQKNLINDYVTVLIPISNAHANEIRGALRTVTGLEGGRAEVVFDAVAKQTFAQVICPEFQVEPIRRAVAALDVGWLRQGVDGSETVEYATRFRPAETVDTFASFYAGEGTTRVDRFRNRVLRRDEPMRADAYLAAAADLDRLPPQAHFEFRIYEVDLSNDLSLGVDWISWKNGPGRSLFEVLFTGQEGRERFDGATGHYNPNLGTVTVTGDGSIVSESTQYLLSANYLLTSAYLDFLRVKGKSRVLAEAEVYAFNNQIGTWSAVDQFLSFEATPSDPDAFGIEPSRLDKGSDFAAHNRFLNHSVGPKNSLGMTLNVAPVIGLESSEVEIEFESDDLAGTTPQGTPIISRRRIVTKLRLIDGQPFVLGGLSRHEDVEASNKAPWLGDLPVLGYLFGQENTVKRSKELVITVVPHFYHGAPTEVTDEVFLDTMAMATGEKEVEMPENSFGFDKWLFDEVEHEP